MNKLINAVLFQLGWWACVLSVSQNLELLAIIFCTCLVGAHLYANHDRKKDLQLLVMCVPIGVAFDTLLEALNIMSFYGWALGFLSPFWLWMVWILFVLTLNHSLSFIKHVPVVFTALLGLIFGSGSYIAGAKLGAASVQMDGSSPLLIALLWAVLLPSLVWLSKRPSRELMY